MRLLQKRGLLLSVLLTAALILCVFGSLLVGRFGLSAAQVLGVLFGQEADSTVRSVIFDMRIPRIAAAILVGMSLSASGSVYQGILRNPMVSPDILGASAGASLGAALGILLSLSPLGVELLAFSFGLCAVFCTYFLSGVFGKANQGALLLVLSGMVIGNLFTAGISAIKFIADPNSKLPEITFWLMGGLSNIQNREILMLLIPFCIGILPLLLMRWQLNVMTLGDDEAASLGINTARTRLIAILGSTLITSAAVSVSGMVGWVGLVIPHIARMLAGPDFRTLLPVSMLTGGIFLLAVDTLARSVYTAEIPISILTSVVGAPLFVVLLIKQKQFFH